LAQKHIEIAMITKLQITANYITTGNVIFNCLKEN